MEGDLRYTLAHQPPSRLAIAQSDDPMVPLDVKVNIHKELLNYMAPKLKSIDMEKRGTETINVMIQNFGELEEVQSIPVDSENINDAGLISSPADSRVF